LLGTEADVLEHGGSAHARAGDLLYARRVHVEGLALLDGSSPVLIPPVHKPRVIELRRSIVAGGAGSGADLFGAELLREWDGELREVYLEIANALLYPQMPVMQNTDGDPLEMHTLAFELDTPAAAYDALKDLTAGVSEPDIERDAAGEFVRAEMTWARLGNKMHKDWKNTTRSARSASKASG
jgi:hypothetical protein